MYIKSIAILNTAEEKVMRRIDFHLGVNTVVDLAGGGSHNLVGKTTLLRLIDILLGAGNKKGLYVDADTKSVNEPLERLICEKRVAATMELAGAEGGALVRRALLRVDLWPRGCRYIDGVKHGEKEYGEELNSLIFGISSGKPTFRQLMNSFVRISQSGDNDTFLRTLTSGKTSEYRSIYNHLFDISDPNKDAEMGELRDEMRQVENSAKLFRKLRGAADLNTERQVLSGLRYECERVERGLDDIISADAYRENRDRIMEARAEYSALIERIGGLEYRIDQVQRDLESARAERSRRADPETTRRFFDEVSHMLPDLDRTFQEMVRFNEKLTANKIAFLEETREDLQARRSELQTAADRLLGEKGELLSLLQDDGVERYERELGRLLELRQKIGEKEEAIEALGSFEDRAAQISDRLSEMESEGPEMEGGRPVYETRMDTFNRMFFTPLAERINGEGPMLVYVPEKSEFPVKIESLLGSSTGTRKSLIAAYDLAYQRFARHLDIKTPNFVVHDVVESIEGPVLARVVEAANEQGSSCQYIFAVLQEKLDSSGVSEETQRSACVISLSEHDRLFEGETVERNEAESRAFEYQSMMRIK